MFLKRMLKHLLHKRGYIIKESIMYKYSLRDGIYIPLDIDIDNEFKSIYIKPKKYTMSSIERMFALYKATQYIVKNDIPGDLVECGVWRGGSSMLMAFVLELMNEKKRSIFLYDTFEGMDKPIKKDINILNKSADDTWREMREKGINKWDYSPIEEVKKNMFETGFPKERLIFVKGKVEDTIPVTIPDKISLLRLDTDWYESTYHELIYLFPKLSKGGVIIIDDYMHWKGAKEATDKYFRENSVKILLNRIDYTGVIGIKTST